MKARPTRRSDRTVAQRTGYVALIATAAALILAGAAPAVVPVGLQNGGFEQSPDFNGWTAQTVREAGYGAPATVEPATCAPPRGICIVGSDMFTPVGGGPTPVIGLPITVAPLEGTRMARLGGPFTSNVQSQVLERYVLSQTFVVDPANPVLTLNYNVFTYDFLGFDKLQLDVKLTDENGTQITQLVQGGFGSSINLKNTGWRSANIDLTGYENQQVRLSISSGGTWDTVFGFWSYIDSGQAPLPPVAAPAVQPPTNPVTNQPVPINTFDGGASNQSYIVAPASQAAQFPGGCMPLPLSVPINGAGAAVSNVSLLLIPSDGSGTQSFPMSDPESDGTWTGTITCAKTGGLFVQYTLTEGTSSQSFVVPIGGLTLIDPAGIVYDKQQYDAAVAGGSTPAQARAAAAVAGATVRLQRKVAGVFTNVLAGDPGISPHINPETTGANGQYQWDVSAGTYRVVVARSGYEVATSEELEIPPPRTDVHIALVKTAAAVPADGDGDGVPDSTDQCPAQAAATANGCPTATTTTTGPGSAANGAAKGTGAKSPGTKSGAKTPGAATVTGATRTVRVSKAGRFTFRFRTAPSTRGTVRFDSTKAVKIGSLRRMISLGARSFESSAAGLVAVKVKLSSKQLRALSKQRSLRFRATVTIGAQRFGVAVKLTAPKG